MKRYRNLLFILLAFFAGSFATLSTGLVFANGSDVSQIHGCIRNNGLLSGFVRIVGINVNCANNETALDWAKEAGNNGQPLTCPNCNFYGDILGSRFAGKNLTNAYLPHTQFDGANFTGTNLTNAVISFSSFNSVDFTGANLTGSNFSYTNIGGDNFTNANLSNIDLTNSNIGGNFTNANLTGANLTNASIAGSTGLNTATLTGVIWSNTVCPDSTNSDNDGGTCVGHLTP